MSESERVQRWREAKRTSGRKALTIWVTAERELRAKDLAAQWHSSVSEIFEQALDQFQPTQAQRISNVADIEQIRQLIKDEVAASLAMQTAVTATVADTVTDTMLEEDAPVVDTGILEAVTATNNGNVTDTQALPEADAPDMKQCKHGHEPYDVSRAECPTCVRERKRRSRERAGR